MTTSTSAESSATTNETTTTEVHPLMKFQTLRPLRNWEEWLERWDQAVSFEELLGLLHVGFRVPYQYEPQKHTRISRLVFYLKVADQRFSSHNLQSKEEEFMSFNIKVEGEQHERKLSPGELRGLLAKKAFVVFSNEFFKPVLELKRTYDDYHWKFYEMVFADEELLRQLRRFFREETNERGAWRFPNIRSNNDSPSEKLMLQFLHALADFMWTWENGRIWSTGRDPKEAAFRSMIEEMKPWMMGVFAHLDDFSHLHNQANNRWHALNQACLAKIEAIALQTELSNHLHLVSNRRLAATVEEAAFADCSAAKFLLSYRLQEKTEARLKEVLNLEREEKEIARKRQALVQTT